MIKALSSFGLSYLLVIISSFPALFAHFLSKTEIALLFPKEEIFLQAESIDLGEAQSLPSIFGTACTPSSIELSEPCAGDSASLILNDLTEFITYTVTCEIREDTIRLADFVVVGTVDPSGTFIGKTPPLIPSYDGKTFAITSIANNSNAPCSETFTDELTTPISVNTVTPNFTTNPSDVCSGESSVFTLSQSFPSYQWSATINSDSAFVVDGGDSTDNFIEILWDNSQGNEGIVSVIATTAQGCSGSFSDTISIKQVPLLKATKDTVCSGQLVDLDLLYSDSLNLVGERKIYRSLLDAQNEQDSLASSIIFPDSSVSYFVRKNVGSCFDIIEVPIVVIGVFPKLNTTNFSMCVGQTVDILNFVTDSSSVIGTIKVYEKQQDAENELNVLDSTLVSPDSTRSFYVRKNNGNACFDIAEIIVNVNENPIVTFADSSYQSFCQDTGKVLINVTPLGGVWQGAVDSLGQFGLEQVAGIYPSKYIFTDSITGCADSAELNIRLEQKPTLQITDKKNPSCTADNGSITMSAQGGTQPYLYSLNGVQFNSSPSFSSLAAGNYTLFVRDAMGCISSIRDSLAIPPGPSGGVDSVINVTCKGDSTGSIKVIASLGLSPYTYAINEGPFVASDSFGQLAAGTYRIQIKDSANCIFEIEQEVTEPTMELDVQRDTSKIASCDASDGEITLLATGGTGPYVYSKDSLTNFQISPLFTGLPEGQFTFYVQDALRCVDTVSVSLADSCCPSFEVIGASKDSFCDTEPIQLSASLVDADNGTLVWEQIFDNGTAPIRINRPDSVRFSTANCTNSIVKIRARYLTTGDFCGEIISDTLSLTVFPSLNLSLIQLSECEVILPPLCPGLIVSWSDNLGNSGNSPSYSAAAGTSGKVDFTVINPNLSPGDSCYQESISWEFNCPSENCVINSIEIGPSTTCNGSNNSFGQALTINYQTAPAEGSLNINGKLFPIEGSPQTVILSSLPANGQFVDIKAFFTADSTCQFIKDSAFLAPQPCGPVNCKIESFLPDSYAVTLHDLPFTSDSLYIFQSDGAIQFNTGNTVSLTGTLKNRSDSSIQWYIDLSLINGDPWNAWDLKNRGIRSNPNTSDTAIVRQFFDTWKFWELGTNSQLFGMEGKVDGMVLTLSHNFGNAQTGFQLGFGADNRTGNYGMSGDFLWTGTFQDSSISGIGGLNLSVDCDTSPGNLVPFSLITDLKVDGEEMKAPYNDSLRMEEKSQLDIDFLLIEREEEVQWKVDSLANDSSSSVISGPPRRKNVTFSLSPLQGKYTYSFIAKNEANQQSIRSLFLDVEDFGFYPVQLLFFDAVKIGGKNVQLAWETAAEFSGTIFQVERSLDGGIFTVLTEVQGTGNLSSGSNTYSYKDLGVPGEFAFYRLKQIGPNGNQQVSEIVRIIFDSNEEPVFTLFPNPAQDLLQLRIPISTEGIYEILIINEMGQKVHQELLSLQPGFFAHEIAIQNFSPAFYMIRIYGPGIGTAKRFQKL